MQKYKMKMRIHEKVGLELFIYVYLIVFPTYITVSQSAMLLRA